MINIGLYSLESNLNSKSDHKTFSEWTDTLERIDLHAKEETTQIRTSETSSQ